MRLKFKKFEGDFDIKNIYKKVGTTVVKLCCPSKDNKNNSKIYLNISFNKKKHIFFIYSSFTVINELGIPLVLGSYNPGNLVSGALINCIGNSRQNVFILGRRKHNMLRGRLSSRALTKIGVDPDAVKNNDMERIVFPSTLKTNLFQNHSGGSQ